MKLGATQNPRFFSTRPRKGKSKQLQKKASRVQSPSPELPPLPIEAFPHYSSASSTPLPPPAMPRKPFLRRVFPLLIAGTGAYVLLRTSNRESSEKNAEIRMETSASVLRMEVAVAEETVN